MSRIDYWATTSTHEYVYQKAGEYYSDGKYGDALTLYRELMNSGVDDDLYYNAALCCNKLGEFKQAADYLEKSLALNDRRFDAFVLLAEIYSGANENSKAIYNYTRARALKPDYPPACLVLADLCQKQGMEFEAVYYRTKFLQFSKDKRTPEYRRLNNEINNARAEAGRYTVSGARALSRGDVITAVNEYRNAYRFYPADYDTNIGLARGLNDTGDFNGALRHFIRAAYLNNSDSRLFMYIASVYSKIRDYQRAYCFAKRYLNTLISAHNQAEYLKTIKTVNSLEPYSGSGNVSEETAENYFASNRYYEAYLEYENLSILSPEPDYNITVRFQLLELMVNPEKYWSKLYLKKAQSLYNSGKHQEANGFFSRVMDLSPQNSEEYKSARAQISYV